MKTPHHPCSSNICHMNISCNLQSTTHMFVIQLTPRSSVIESCDQVVLCLFKNVQEGQKGEVHRVTVALKLHCVGSTLCIRQRISRAMPRLTASRWLLPCSRPCVFADAISKLSPLRLPSPMTVFSRICMSIVSLFCCVSVILVFVFSTEPKMDKTR